uniref:Twist-related protein 1 n=1 Tax=Aceria tosichella TaxID=561515 RepID=A0A6G1SB80_9ACAR
MNNQKRRLTQNGFKKETNQLKLVAQSSNEQSTANNNQRFSSQQQQVIYAAHLDAGPLAYLQVIDNNNSNNNNNNPATSIHIEQDSRAHQKHFSRTCDQQRQYNAYTTTSSLQDGDGSPYFSDSTLSNCDRELDATDAAASLARPEDSRQQAPNSSTNNMHQQPTHHHSHNNNSHNNHNRHHHHHHQQTVNTNHPIRCNSANGVGQLLPQRGVRKRVMANERERERTKSLNQALEILRNRLPVPEAEKRSKIQTLRMAKEYIEFLTKFKYISSQDQQQDHQLSSSSMMTCNESRQYDNKSCSHDRCGPQQQQQQQVVSGSTQYQNQPNSPLTYKFYKFRLKSHSRVD